MFDTTIVWLSTVLVVLVGLVARVLLAVLVITAVAVPLAGLIYLWKGTAALLDRVIGIRRLGHVLWRRGCYYTPGHMWLRPEGARLLKVGLDDVAQRVLPDVRSVHLPAEGTAIRQGQEIGRIDCDGGAVTLRAPVAGVIRAVNTRLLQEPSLLHDDPYRRGWMLELTPEDDRYKEFASDSIAPRWLAAEDQRLARFFEQQLGIAAADGGELVLPPHQLLTRQQWEEVRQGFLDAA
jgi:glycine cleavage system H protein